jgi:SNF2 family DNA or RNA helicase
LLYPFTSRYHTVNKTPEKLKCLSLRQPWAELVIQGHKQIEYRSQPTKIRGRVYIYASLGDVELDEDEQLEIEEMLDCPIAELQRGMVVGTVEIFHCDEGNDCFEWYLRNPQRLPESLKPVEHPQPVWFHPFGRPDSLATSSESNTSMVFSSGGTVVRSSIRAIPKVTNVDANIEGIEPATIAAKTEFLSVEPNVNPSITSADLPRLIDNKGDRKLVDIIRSQLVDRAIFSIMSNEFTLFAFEALVKQLKRLSSTRLLIGSQSPHLQSSWLAQALLGNAADRAARNRLENHTIAKQCLEWLSNGVACRSVNMPVMQNLYHVSSDQQFFAVNGSSSFTTMGLGLTPSVGMDMNTCFQTKQETESLLAWFDTIWANPMSTQDSKPQLQSALSTIVQDNSPEFIYYLTLYNIFKDSLEDVREDKIIKSQTGIKDTIIWNKLYQFQRDGVLGAINKMERFNGCIIADSVGLGKTFEALAIIKYYELRNDRVLVLCPKKLRENWTIYTINDKRNLLAADRFNFDVLNHTDLTRTQGMSGEINLETINWGNYDLVVIDESHNFRNSTPQKEKGLTRYSRLMQEIIRSGVRTKVLMLSATPVNNRMNDLKNQVAFITEGIDSALEDIGIKSVEQSLRLAQTRFNQWLQRDPKERNIGTLLDALNFEYFKLLDTLTIARSRKHVEKYYDTSEIGAFPERLKPINIKADIDSQSLFSELKEVNKDIRRLNLASFAPFRYILPAKREEYGRKYDFKLQDGSMFKQIDREENLIHLMRVNLLKRMESSIHSFGLTLGRLHAGVTGLLERIDNHESKEIEELSIEDIDTESTEFDNYLVGNKVKVLLQDLDLIRWRQELDEDRDLLVRLLRDARDIGPSRDDKLQKLKALIRQKIANPINSGNRKVIVFTAFADTADYLYENLASWVKSEFGMYSATVSGVGSNQTTMPKIRKDLSSIITSFSPISKERDKVDANLTDSIDLLIATDCISEGQNLQDCDYLVNYDIHWNPVRIIQRFGRIDRLGSRNERIQLVNFWPNMELDEYINLEARVSGRMVLLDISATGEENVIADEDQKKMNDLDYRRRQLEQLQNEVVDMEDLGGGISITDMTLNDFRMNLGEYLKQNADALESAPLGVFAVTEVDDLLGTSDLAPGVIFCLRSESSKIRVDSSYGLAPYFLAYVSDAGEVKMQFTQARKILDILKKLTLGHKQPNQRAIKSFQATTRNGRDLGRYRDLLAKAVTSISGKAEEKGVETLFQRGGTVLSKNGFRGIEDFEVVAFLIVVDSANGEGVA